MTACYFWRTSPNSERRVIWIRQSKIIQTWQCWGAQLMFSLENTQFTSGFFRCKTNVGCCLNIQPPTYIPTIHWRRHVKQKRLSWFQARVWHLSIFSETKALGWIQQGLIWDDDMGMFLMGPILKCHVHLHPISFRQICGDFVRSSSFETQSLG